MEIRNATLSDLDQIMLVEEMSFGEGITPEAVATRAYMEACIALFAEKSFPEGFLVAAHNGALVGYIIMYPTHMEPGQHVSLETSIDSGLLSNVFAHDGRNTFIVSFCVMDTAPAGTTELLMYRSQIVRLRRLQTYEYQSDYLMFCVRIPDCAHARDDVLFNLFLKITTDEPCLPSQNGYVSNHHSGGRGVLFAIKDPFKMLDILALRIFGT